MTFVRQVRLDAAVDTGYPKYRAVMATSLESTMVLGCWIDTGGSGPPLHLHSCDQFYVFLAGHTTVQIGAEIQEAGAGDVIFIPAGMPHCNWNQSGAQEHHLEIMAPGIRPGLPLLTAVTSLEEVPTPAGKPYTRTLNAGEATSIGAMTQWRVADEASGVESSRIQSIELATCEEPIDTQVLNVDHLIFVLDGCLNLSIADQLREGNAQSLIVIPAGVAHSQWNLSSSPVRYLDLRAPAPEMYTNLAPPPTTP